MRARRLLGLVLTAVACVGVATAPPATALTRPDVVSAAVQYATSRGYEAAVAVYDLQTGRYYGGGDDYGLFASESVVKTFVAARLLATGQMHGTTESLAWKMITKSDNAATDALYGRVGGDALIDWVKAYYDVPHLGYRPVVAGHWGATRITAGGMVHFYAHVRHDPAVDPWLLNAMHHASPTASNGANQVFGLFAATSGAAIKQGWGYDADDFPTTRADVNSTGYVNGERYAAAVFLRGPVGTLAGPIYTVIDGAARALLPAGQFPNVVPEITGMSHHAGSTSGGTRIILFGSGFAGALGVNFGTVPARSWHVVDDRHVRVVTPAHSPGAVTVHVVTPVRVSGYGVKAHFTFVS